MKRNESKTASMSFTRKKLLSLILCIGLILALIVLFSCENGNNTDVSDDNSQVSESVPVETLPDVPEETDIKVVEYDKCHYAFIRSANCTSQLRNAISSMCSEITDEMLYYTVLRQTVDTDAPQSSSGTLEVLIGATDRAESTEAAKDLKSGDWQITVQGSKIIILGYNDEATIEAVNWFKKNFVTDFAELTVPKDFNYIKSKAPAIVEASQEEYYYSLDVNDPTITFAIQPANNSVVNLEGFYVDGKDLTKQVTLADNVLTMSGVSFEDGTHIAKIILSSSEGCSGYGTLRFGCGKCDDMNLYIGELHAHCADSDGTGTARQAYEYARDIAGLDFFALTDHSSSLSEARYISEHVPLANEMNEPGKFVALYGYEQTYSYTTGYYGHLNTINSTRYTTTSIGLLQYYKTMTKTTDAIVQFNHPGYSWGNFLEYGMYSKAIDNVVNLYEFKGSGYDNEWALCLAKGWHVSPVHNEDNHSGQWGTVNEAVGVVLAPSLTRQNITEALNLKRSYTTTDQSLKIYFSINDTWLGGTLTNPEELNVTVKLSTKKSAGLGTVYLVAEDNIVVASANARNKQSIEWNVTVSPEYDYYYIKVDGGCGFAVTAPVWIEGRNLLNITDMDRSLVCYENNSTKDHRVTVKFKNDSDKTMTDVKVSFYASALSGFNVETATPLLEKTIGNLAAGVEGQAFADVDYVSSSPRITAVVSGTVDGKTYKDTLYLQLQPLLMSEIHCSTSGYSYIEIYNATTSDINLSSYSVRYWPKTGAKSDALTENTVKLSGTVKAHQTLVVWMKLEADTALTEAQFNSHFNTSLKLGTNLIAVKSIWIPQTKRGTQIDLLSGSTVIARCQYNFGENTNDISNGTSVIFEYQDAYTLLEKLSKNKQSPTPGTLDASLMPTLITNP